MFIKGDWGGHEGKALSTEDLLSWFNEEVKRRRIFLTKKDMEEILRALERREWISLNPELFEKLRARASEALAEELKKADGIMSQLREAVLEKIDILEVEADEGLASLEAIGSDASSHPIPLAISRIALISGIAVRDPPRTRPSILGDVVCLSNERSRTEFRFIMSARREALIPLTILHQATSFGTPEAVFIDGPLSISQWYKKAWTRDVREAVGELVRARRELIGFCAQEDALLISIVKRGRSRYFHNYIGIADKSPYSDQTLFHYLLRPGERTEAISITRAIRRWRSGVSPKDLLINHLRHEIYGFYIKTSHNPFSPPIRVEFPENLRGREEEIASLVLSTAVPSADLSFDGLPRALCVAHRDAKITAEMMRHIYRERIYEVAEEGMDMGLMASSDRVMP